jgi:hypothetical protein
MIIKVKDKGYVSQPFVAPELTLFYNGRQIENITLSIDKKNIEIGEEVKDIEDLSSIKLLNLHIDENFLYVQVGDKVKRIPLSEF